MERTILPSQLRLTKRKTAEELFRRAIKLMAQDPNRVNIRAEWDGFAIKMDLITDSKNKAILIGKGGRNYKELKMLGKILFDQASTSFQLGRIQEIPGGDREFAEFEFQQNWDGREVLDWIRDVMEFIFYRSELTAIHQEEPSDNPEALNIRVFMSPEPPEQLAMLVNTAINTIVLPMGIKRGRILRAGIVIDLK